MRSEGDSPLQVSCGKQGRGAAASNKKFLRTDHGRMKNGYKPRQGGPITKELETQNKQVKSFDPIKDIQRYGHSTLKG